MINERERERERDPNYSPHTRPDPNVWVSGERGFESSPLGWYAGQV